MRSPPCSSSCDFFQILITKGPKQRPKVHRAVPPPEPLDPVRGARRELHSRLGRRIQPVLQLSRPAVLQGVAVSFPSPPLRARLDPLPVDPRQGVSDPGGILRAARGPKGQGREGLGRVVGRAGGACGEAGEVLCRGEAVSAVLAGLDVNGADGVFWGVVIRDSNEGGSWSLSD